MNGWRYRLASWLLGREAIRLARRNPKVTVTVTHTIERTDSRGAQ